jgi:hypothetical protein
VEVALKRCTTLGLGIARIVATLFLVAVAVVPTCTMLRPQPHAHPAEFVLALPASHVVTTTILLDGRVALGTLFGVCRNPVSCFRVIFALLHPQLDKHTRGRLVVI